MRIEVDQSGKFEQLNTNTVVAGANDKVGAIRLSTSVKRRLIQGLRKSLIPRKDLLAVVFGILVFLLLDDLGKFPNMIITDKEYTGKEDIIRETLEKLISRKTKGRWQGHIRFKQVGKFSPAHRLAWQLHRKKKKTIEKKILEKDVLQCLG